MMKIMKQSHFMMIVIMSLASCGDGFLDIKPEKALVVPHTLDDLQALLDNSSIMNNNTPYMPELSTTDFYVSDDAARTQAVMEQNAYKWAADIYEGSDDALDWNHQYQVVYYANLVLELLEKADKENRKTTADEIKGSALFFRAKAFYHLAQQYCLDYNASSSESDLGIALRLQSDHNIKSVRASVLSTYTQILKDLHEAITLLPSSVSVKTRPSVYAGFALLAKTYLQMKDYRQALAFADKALKFGALIDYRNVDSSLDYPFEQFNDEVIYHGTMVFTWFFHETNLVVDPEFFALYGEQDLRRDLFFKKNEEEVTYRGSYDGTYFFFSGLALDELYLIKAECEARIDQVPESMKTLNMLLDKRHKEGFRSVNVASKQEAIKKITVEKRKQLLFRGIRWSDLRRLNQYPEESTTLERMVEGVRYELPPNDPRYVFPLSDITLRLSDMQQNPR